MEFEAEVVGVAEVCCEEWSGFRSLESFRSGFGFRFEILVVQWWLVVAVYGGVVKALCRRKNEEWRDEENRKKEKRESLGASCCHDMTRQNCGSPKLNEIIILPLSFSFQVLKTPKTCFHFPSPKSIFWVFESWKQWYKTQPNKCSSIGPIQFG